MILLSDIPTIEDMRRRKLISAIEADKAVFEARKVLWPDHDNFKWDDKEQRYTRRDGKPLNWNSGSRIQEPGE